MSARTPRKGDRFDLVDYPVGRSTSWLCRDENGTPIVGTHTGYEITAIRSGLAYYLPVFDCCDRKHDRTVTGSRARPDSRPVDEIANGQFSNGIGGRNFASIRWIIAVPNTTTQKESTTP